MLLDEANHGALRAGCTPAAFKDHVAVSRRSKWGRSKPLTDSVAAEIAGKLAVDLIPLRVPVGNLITLGEAP